LQTIKIGTTKIAIGKDNIGNKKDIIIAIIIDSIRLKLDDLLVHK
jgi:hypothetical protein